MGAEINRERFLSDIRNIGRNSGHRSADIAVVVAAMVAATYLCPNRNDGEPGFHYDGDELTNARWLGVLETLSRRWQEAGKREHDPFETAKRVQSWSPGALEHLKRLVIGSQWEATDRHRHTVPAWLGQALIELANSWGSPYRADASKLPRLIVDIITDNREAETIAKPRVSCGYDFAAEVAIEIAAAGLEVDLDLQRDDLADICQCISFADNLALHVRCGDPVKLARGDKAAAGVGHGPSHDIAIAIPPFNDKSHATDADMLGTGLPRPANSESVGVALALARGRKLAVCVVPAGFLFQASKANQVFKEYAIADFGLDTVVSLPSGAFQFAAIATGLILFKPLTAKNGMPSESGAVYMIAARGERGRSAAGMGLLDGLGKLIRNREITPESSLVTVREIAANDFVLQPERYIESPEVQRLRALEASSTFVSLEDLVEFLRPQAVRKVRDDETAAATFFEVAVADLDDVGRVGRPIKQVSVPRDAVIHTRRVLLKLGDIILVIKGSIGKVGFVCDIPDDAETDWLASQSFVILRLRPHAPIRDPRVLFRYLSSSLGQKMLQSLRVGATVPGLQIGDVRRLSVAVPRLEKQEEIKGAVTQMFAMQDDIEATRASLSMLQANIWPE